MPSPQNWSGHGFSFDDVIEQWAEVANSLADYELVQMVVRPEDRRRAKKYLDGEIEVLEFPVNDGWARDTAPMFVVNGKGERRAVGCTFNGWGDKFEGKHQQDALIKAHLSRAMEAPMYPIDLVSEGNAGVRWRGYDSHNGPVPDEPESQSWHQPRDDRPSVERSLRYQESDLVKRRYRARPNYRRAHRRHGSLRR